MQNALCIGGPLDGTVTQIETGRDCFTVPAFVPSVSPYVNDSSMEPVQYRTYSYTRRRLFDITIWAPDVMREQQIVQLLIQRYFQ